jgi:hypothetical protein
MVPATSGVVIPTLSRTPTMTTPNDKAKATIASNDEGFLVAPLSAGFPLNASFLVSIISSPLKIDI